MTLYVDHSALVKHYVAEAESAAGGTIERTESAKCLPPSFEKRRLSALADRVPALKTQKRFVCARLPEVLPIQTKSFGLSS